MAGAPLESEGRIEQSLSISEQKPFKVCASCALVYPSAKSWETATRPVNLIEADGSRTRGDELRLCPCGAPMVRD